MAAVAAVAAPPVGETEEKEQQEVPPEKIALKGIDGHGIDRIEVKFSGRVKLDRSDPADVALMRQLKLGKEVEFKIVGVVKGKPFEIVHDEDGYPGEVTSVAQLGVTSLYRPVGEDGVEARVGSQQLDLGGLNGDGPGGEGPH
jgi:hypothetical protein